MIRIVMADDQDILRRSLRVILEQDSGIKVVGEASDGCEAFRLCEELRPDVVLMDIGMPVCDGVEGTRRIKAVFPEIRVLVLTTFRDESNMAKAMALGADGYILKDIRPAELIAAVHQVASGLSVLGPDVLTALVRNMHPSAVESPEEKRHAQKILTEREMEVVVQVVQGKSNREIGEVLFISEGRVRNIVTEILAKLEIQDRTQLAVYAVKKGWV